MLELLESAISSPWAYFVLFAIALLDAFLPVVPSETLVITAGVFAAATGEPAVLAVIAVAALGAFLGDHVSYQIGRRAGAAVLRGPGHGHRRRRAFAWAEGALSRRGGLLLVVARSIPGGRTATTLTAGAVGYSAAKFAAFDAIAAVTWGVYATMIGYLGGAAFHDDPGKGLLVGLGLAATITVLVEVTRYVGHRRRRRRSAAAWPLERRLPRRRPGAVALRARPVPRRAAEPSGHRRMAAPAAQPTPAWMGRRGWESRGPRGRG